MLKFLNKFFLATVIMAVFTTSANSQVINLPDIGSTADATLSPDQEKRLGEAFMRNLRQSLEIVDDPVVNSYVQDIGNRLVSHVENYPLDFTFFVVNDPTINAFAGPGGYIGVNTGLILATDSESELASVLAHETAHVTQRHLQRSFETANKLNLPTAAAIIAAMILGAQTNNGQAAEALLAATMAGSAQTQINFTRAHEAEADRVGMQLLEQAGFDPRAMPAFFEKLQQESRLYASSAIPEFLSTHPVTLERISDTRNRAEQYPHKKVQSSTGYYLARAKIQAILSKDPAKLVKQYTESLKSGKFANAIGEKYGYALALYANRNYQKALQTITQLIQHDRERVPYLVTKAQIEIDANNLNRANKTLDNALKLYPHNEPLTELFAQTLIDMRQPEKAKLIIQEQIRYSPSNPAIYKLLAQAEDNLGFSGSAHQALAEYYYLDGNIHQAIEQLQLALQQKNSDKQYAKSRIEARLKQFKEEALLEQQFEDDINH